MTLEGQLSREHFGGEVWVLRTADGQYELKGRVPAALDGRRVRVKASRAKEAYGFSMVGTIVNVESISPVG